jgi:uncharacterized protein (TIGR02284 family)
MAGGGAGFSRFLSLAAGAGESRAAGGPRTSQNSTALIAPNMQRKLQGQLQMATDTAKNFELETVLKSVINILEDGQKGMAEIGEHLKDETLKRYFLAESLKRASFRGELENELHRHGVHDVHETGTVAGAVHRAWGGLKATLGGGDHTLLATAEAGEDEAKDAYKDALDQELPMPIRQLLVEQQTHILMSHDFVRGHRDALAAK